MTKNKLTLILIAVIVLTSSVSIGSVYAAQQADADAPYTNTYYVSAGGSDSNDGLSEATPFLTLAKTADAVNSDPTPNGNYLIYIMSNLTSTACARYYDNSVTIMSDPNVSTIYTITRGAGFSSLSDTARGWYNPPMVEIESNDYANPDADQISLTLKNIIFDDVFRHEGTIFGNAPTPGVGTGTTFVQDGMITSYAWNATIILDDGAELRNFGGMRAVCAGYGANVVMKSGSTITDIRPNASTNNRQVSTSATDWAANGEAAVSVSGGDTSGAVGLKAAGSFFMYSGAKITNIANAHSVKLSGTYRCFIDGEIGNMIGNKGMDTDPGGGGRGFKNAVYFNGYGRTLDLYSDVPGSAVIGPNANIHDNAIKCGAIGISRSVDVSVKIYGKVNNNTGGTGSTMNLAGTNGGGLYIVAGGTIYLEDGCEIIGNRTTGLTSYGAAASIQQNGSKLIMNGGTVSGNVSPSSNTPASVSGIAVNKGNASFEMNGGLVDNGVNGVWLFNNSTDTDCNGQIILNNGTVSGVTVHSTVAYGTNTLNTYRNLFISPDVTINTGYVSVAGKQVKPLSADFNIGNPNAANYTGIKNGMPQGWTMPTTDANVIGFWMKKNGMMEFSVPAPTTGTSPTGYDRTLDIYFVAVQGTLANGTTDASSPVVFLPVTRGADSSIIVNVPLNAYPNGATVALVQPTTDYGTILFGGLIDLDFDPSLPYYDLPYSAVYSMPDGFRAALVGAGWNPDTITLHVKPDPRTVLDPTTLTIDSEIFVLTGVSVWDPVTGVWAISLALKSGWETGSLTTTIGFNCTMAPADYQDGGVLTLTGDLIMEKSGERPYLIYGNTVNTNMTIPSYGVTYEGNGEDSGIPPVDPDSPHKQNSIVTVLGNIGVAGDGTDVLVRSGYTFRGWSENPAATVATYTAGSTFTMPGNAVTLYAVWEQDSGGGGGGTKHYYITATADMGSTIAPSGTVTVPANTSKTFTFSANPGYVITAVIVDGDPLTSEQIALGHYTFYNVISNHKISVISEGGGRIGDDIMLTIEIVGGEGTAKFRIGPSGQYTSFNGHVIIPVNSDLYASIDVGKGYRFVEWTGDVESKDLVLHFPGVDKDIYLVAHLEGDGGGEWSVLNLICAVLAIFTGVIVIIAGRDRFKKDGEEKRSRTAMFLRVLALVLGIVSVVVFLLTEDWTAPAMFADKWTPLMIVLLIAAIIAALVSFRFDEKET